MVRVADYDVVKHFDFEKLPGTHQVACNLHVGFRRCCITARVIMGHHDSGSGGHNRQPKDFAGMNQDRVLGADADQIMPLNAAAGVEHQDNEAFTLCAEIRM